MQFIFLRTSPFSTVSSEPLPSVILRRSDVSLMSVLWRWTERSIGRTWVQVEEANLRELLLQAFRRRFSGNRQTLTQDVLKISRHSKTLEQLARSVTTMLPLTENTAANYVAFKFCSRKRCVCVFKLQEG